MAASSESGGVFLVDVLDFPCFHLSPLWWDSPPAWLWDQLLLALPSASACWSLCQSPMAGKEPGTVGQCPHSALPGAGSCQGQAHLLLPALPPLISAGPLEMGAWIGLIPSQIHP